MEIYYDSVKGLTGEEPNSLESLMALTDDLSRFDVVQQGDCVIPYVTGPAPVMNQEWVKVVGNPAKLVQSIESLPFLNEPIRVEDIYNHPLPLYRGILYKGLELLFEHRRAL